MPIVDLALHEPDPASGVGELLVRGENVLAGYWNNPEAPVETFTHGWLHTGDLARIDADGLLYMSTVGAVIVPAEGFDLSAVIADRRERIADYKVPQYIALRDRGIRAARC